MNEVDESMQKALLGQLRDLHLPDAVGWWPPAPGWWVLLALAIMLCIYIVRRLILRRRRHAFRKVAIAELNAQFKFWRDNTNDTNSNTTYLSHANAILRRVVAHRHGNREGAASTGENWIASLNAIAKTPLSSSARESLTDRCYQAQPQVDIESLHQELVTWLTSHKVMDHA